MAVDDAEGISYEVFETEAQVRAALTIHVGWVLTRLRRSTFVSDAFDFQGAQG